MGIYLAISNFLRFSSIIFYFIVGESGYEIEY